MEACLNVGDIVDIVDNIDHDISVRGIIKMIEPDDIMDDAKWVYVVADEDEANIHFHPAIGNYYTLRPMGHYTIELVHRATTE